MHASVEFLRARGAEIEVMSPGEARKRFPQLRFGDDDVCVYDPWSGYIESGRAVSVMADVSRESGVELRENTPVTGIDETPDVVVATGVCVGRLLPEIGVEVKVTHQQMLLIEPRDPKVFAHGVFLIHGASTPTGRGGTASHCYERAM